MSAWHLHATVLPDEQARDLWFTADRISFTPLPDAQTLHQGGYVLPGLVDTHTHPGTVEIGEPLDEDQLRADAAAHISSGTALIRVPGSASRLPAWFGQGYDQPRVIQAGLPIAVEGYFFPGWGRQVSLDGVARAAGEEAGRTGWCKLIVDWFTDDGGYGPSMSADVITAATRAAHGAGGKVAVHTQSAEGGLAAAQAGVDSIEHGMHLPTEALAMMAESGTVLVPTTCTFEAMSPQMNDEAVPADIRYWFSSGVERHAELVGAAVLAGVKVLAGTDLPPGSLTEEIRWLASAGLSAHEALGAGSWAAREWLGLAGIEDGAPADLLVFDTDPREDLNLLDDPAHVVVRGRLPHIRSTFDPAPQST